MIVVRATQKVLRSLPESAPKDAVSTTALGDWCVNRVVVDRQPLLLMVSSLSLLAIIEPARGVKGLPARLSGLVADRLGSLGVHRRLIGLEIAQMDEVLVGRTKDRSVTGTLVDFAKALPYYLPSDGWGPNELRIAEERFSQTPCRCGGSNATTIWPASEAVALLEARWHAPHVVH